MFLHLLRMWASCAIDQLTRLYGLVSLSDKRQWQNLTECISYLNVWIMFFCMSDFVCSSSIWNTIKRFQGCWLQSVLLFFRWRSKTSQGGGIKCPDFCFSSPSEKWKYIYIINIKHMFGSFWNRCTKTPQTRTFTGPCYLSNSILLGGFTPKKNGKNKNLTMISWNTWRWHIPHTWRKVIKNVRQYHISIIYNYMHLLYT